MKKSRKIKRGESLGRSYVTPLSRSYGGSAEGIRSSGRIQGKKSNVVKIRTKKGV